MPSPNALKPNSAFSPDGTGTSRFAARFDDERLAAVASFEAQESPEALGTTTNLTAIDAVFDDLADARVGVDTLKTETEARLDAIEAKLDAVIGALEDAGVFTVTP